MTLGEIRAVGVKELRGLLRDRNVLLYSVAVPAFLYPALVLGVVEATLYFRGLDERLPSRVELLIPASGEGLRADVARILKENEARIDVDARPGPQPDCAEARRDLEGSHPRRDAILVLSGGATLDAQRLEGAGAMRADVFFHGAKDRSLAARQRLEKTMESLRVGRVEALARGVSAEAGFAAPLRIEATSLSTPEELGNHIAALILPLVLILMTALGAYYPALDVTVGERERGTVETTLLAPIGRRSLVAGKYLAVGSMAFVSFSLNFAGLAITLAQLSSQVHVEGLRVGFWPLVVIAAAAVFLAALFGALFLLVASLAKSFKEGQSYVSPIFLLALAPIVVTSNPEAHLTPLTAAVPLLNTALLIRGALESRLELLSVAVALGTSVLYAVLALGAAARCIFRDAPDQGRPGAAAGAWR